MERLTDKRMNEGGAISASPKEYKELAISESLSGEQICKGILDIKGILGDKCDLDRLRELVEADRDGRCIILRFKPGMFVYRVWPRCDRRKFPFMTSHYLDCKEACIEAQLWNDVYGSEEAAKAALNKLKEAEME